MWRYYYLRKKKKTLLLTVLFCLFCWFILKKYVLSNKYSYFIPVFVVEEHHEALPYWIDVANEGAMSRSGNTLIHIDGHSDEGLPEHTPDFPMFHWPWKNEQLDLLLQQNDIFIMDAVIIGLIDRLIWITPEWNNETMGTVYEIEDIDIGTAKVVIEGEETIVFCKCIFRQPDPDKPTVRECLYMNRAFEPPGDPEVVLSSPDLCEVKGGYTLEVITAEVALQYTETDKWISPSESIILDIDEDYFGCEIPGQKLYNVGMNWDDISSLDQKLKQVFCPKFIEHEYNASQIMSKVVEVLIEKCAYKFTDRSDKKCVVSESDVIKETGKIFLLDWISNPLLYCNTTDVTLLQETQNMISAFYQLSPNQLHAILKMGFCFNTSPRTLWFQFAGQLVICHGNNDPARPMVQVHIPDSAEVEESMSSITKLMTKLPKPKAVTLCRSGRDGYTPKSIAKTVDDTLISHFRKQKKIKQGGKLQNIYDIIYDENLMKVSGIS